MRARGKRGNKLYGAWKKLVKLNAAVTVGAVKQHVDLGTISKELTVANSNIQGKELQDE